MKIKYIFLILLLAGTVSAQFQIGRDPAVTNSYSLSLTRTYLDGRNATGSNPLNVTWDKASLYIASVGDVVDSMLVGFNESGDSIKPLIYRISNDSLFKFYEPTDWLVSSDVNTIYAMTGLSVELTPGDTFIMAAIGAGDTPRITGVNNTYDMMEFSAGRGLESMVMANVVWRNIQPSVTAYGHTELSSVNKTCRIHPYGLQNRLTDRRIGI